jgi:hypothetical protein
MADNAISSAGQTARPGGEMILPGGEMVWAGPKPLRRGRHFG